jgi:hypothetical protein
MHSEVGIGAYVYGEVFTALGGMGPCQKVSWRLYFIQEHTCTFYIYRICIVLYFQHPMQSCRDL